MSFAQVLMPLRPANSDPDLLKQLETELARIRFGSIQLTIHDGKVVQLDVTEKKRLT